MSLLKQDIMEPVKAGLAETDRILREELLVDNSEAVNPLMDHIGQFSGKRLRPAIVHLCGGLVGGRNHELATIGAMLEALHMATLLHDDVLDGAKVRRQVPTLNTKHGNHIPILLGDLIYARTFDLSLRLPTLDAAFEISHMTQAMCRGEIEQGFFRFDGSQPDESRYFRIILGKTGAMFKAACELGVKYGGGTESEARTMAQFGLDVGAAFQIIDDCLDVVGDERVAGKSLGTDLDTGKVTLPIIRLAGGLDGDRMESLRALLCGEVEGSRRELLRSDFELDQAVHECHQEADQYLHRCLSGLESFPPGPERQSLHDMCSFVLERSY
ncbi:MAG: polyprenyl synthetase family protein [Planctomycetota bacterium]|nr:polyprenyl synthetase family protein [Planctomycetota bacterium]